jgi:hypothetical protein
MLREGSLLRGPWKGQQVLIGVDVRTYGSARESVPEFRRSRVGISLPGHGEPEPETGRCLGGRAERARVSARCSSHFPVFPTRQ